MVMIMEPFENRTRRAVPYFENAKAKETQRPMYNFYDPTLAKIIIIYKAFILQICLLKHE